uniref:Pentatricopeptide repeat-containing protein n=1 Tax=Aegilops tauschii TaxID=37682 RepID=R7W949_AEGTA
MRPRSMAAPATCSTDRPDEHEPARSSALSGKASTSSSRPSTMRLSSLVRFWTGPFAGSSLLATYAKRGALQGDVHATLALFGEAAEPEVILWNAVLGALARACHEAMVHFWRMASMRKAFDPTVMLSGASRAGDMELGMALHGAAVKKRLDTDLNLGNALVDMMPWWDTTS